MAQWLEQARRYLRANSISSNGNEELANYIAAFMQDRGIKTNLQQVTHSVEDVSKRQFNVIGILGDPLVDRKTRKGLLLGTHLDTSSPGIPEHWSETAGDPFAAVMKEGALYGLGTSDAKLDFLCKLRALDRFREKKLKMPVYLVGTCGRELGMLGTRYLIKALTLNPKYVIIGEPTELALGNEHKSELIFRISIGYQLIERDARGFNRRIDLYSLGRSAHGACPAQGINAITQAIEFLQEASDNGFELRFTRLDGGEAVNKVPDRAMTEFYLTSHQFEDFKRFFRESVKLRARERAFRVELGGLGDMGVKFLPDPIFPCLLDVTKFFRDLAGKLSSTSDEDFDPPAATASLSQIRQRPSRIDMYVDLRGLPTQDPEKLAQQVSDGIRDLASQYPGLNLSVARERTVPALSTSPEHELVEFCGTAMEAAGIDVSLLKGSSDTEAALWAQAGYAAVTFGPGSLKDSHAPNEHVKLEQLEKAVGFYERLIERVCL